MQGASRAKKKKEILKKQASVERLASARRLFPKTMSAYRTPPPTPLRGSLSTPSLSPQGTPAGSPSKLPSASPLFSLQSSPVPVPSRQPSLSREIDEPAEAAEDGQLPEDEAPVDEPCEESVGKETAEEVGEALSLMANFD